MQHQKPKKDISCNINKLTPVSWRELVRRLHKLGFDGPYAGGKHPYVINRDLVLTIPNPHSGNIGVDLLSRILKQAGINRKNWNNAK